MVDQAGISALGIAIPDTAIKLSDLAEIRQVDSAKYQIGLECDEMAICTDSIDTVELATKAAQKALSRYHGSIDDIGLIVVATETAKDMSRPFSSWIQEKLNLKGALRSYEVKHACLGGTIAIKQASECVLSGAASGKAALVIATDQSLYTPKSPAEPTQGAGAVAFIIDEHAAIARIEKQSWSWSEPVYDFWRPIGHNYPLVDGPLSLECYKKAALKCFTQMMATQQYSAKALFKHFKAICFHSPFSKMVYKAFAELCTSFDFSENETKAFYHSHVEPFLKFNKKIGNAYTASLWISVAHALHDLKTNEHIAAFSYGSGFGAELLNFTKMSDSEDIGWVEDIQDHIAHRRTYLSQEAYIALRGC